MVPMKNVPRAPGLTIAGLRNVAAGFPPNTPLLVPRANGEGYEPLVMASAAPVSVPLTAAEWQGERDNRAAATPPPAPRRPPP